MTSKRQMLLKVIAPMLLGVIVVVWLFGREFSIDTFREIPWHWRTAGGMALALLAVVGREAGLMWRFRLLSGGTLRWIQALRVTLLVEFASAITPGTSGGGAMSMVFMRGEGIALGRGTVITVTTLFFDELFFVVACPLLLAVVGGSEIFGFAPGTVGAGLRVAFWIAYGLICLVTILLFCGIFISPGAIGTFFIRLTRFKLLHRFRSEAIEAREAMIQTSRSLRRRPIRWWAGPAVATIATWVCRFLVVNALFWGFAAAAPQAVVFGRQAIVWTLLSVTPTPGGSGVSEWLFTTYYGDLLTNASMVLVMAVLWRLISYYVYLIVGIAVVPSWLSNSSKPTSARTTSSRR